MLQFLVSTLYFESSSGQSRLCSGVESAYASLELFAQPNESLSVEMEEWESPVFLVLLSVELPVGPVVVVKVTGVCDVDVMLVLEL